MTYKEDNTMIGCSKITKELLKTIKEENNFTTIEETLKHLIENYDVKSTESAPKMYSELEIIDKIHQIDLEKYMGEHCYQAKSLRKAIIQKFATPQGFRKVIEDNGLVGTKFTKEAKREKMEIKEMFENIWKVKSLRPDMKEEDKKLYYDLFLDGYSCCIINVEENRNEATSEGGKDGV